MNRRQKKQRLVYDNLEVRKMLAGDVNVVENGDLYVRGDNMDNQIRIVAVEPGEIAVVGINGTTINGQQEPFFVSIDSGLHNDSNRIAKLDGGLRIQMHGGNDRVDIQGFKIMEESRVGLGEGNDFIRFIRTAANDDLIVNGEAGDDTVRFIKSRSKRDLHISTDSGNDSLRIAKSGTIGSTVIRTGADHDHVVLNRVRFAGQQQVMTQDGDDLVRIARSGVSESGMDVFTGNGNDEVFAKFTESDDVLGEISLAGQGGEDLLEMIAADKHRNHAGHSGFERGGMVALDNVIGVKEVNGFNYSVYYDINFSSMMATPVSVSQDTSVNEMVWSGIYTENDPPELDNFVIDVYLGDTENPIGRRVQSFSLGNDLERIDSGERVDFVFTNTVLYEFRADVELNLEAGQQYWISVYNVPQGEGESIKDGFEASSTFEWGYRVVQPESAADFAPTKSIEIYNPATGEVGDGGSGRWKEQPYMDLDLRLYS